MRIDPRSGKVLWRAERIGDQCFTSGKFVYATRVQTSGLDMMKAAMDMAKSITQHAPLPLGMIKYMVNKALKIDEHYDLERSLAYHLQSTEDTRAAGEAHRNKQPALGIGRNDTS